jgi:hypothetical protein
VPDYCALFDRFLGRNHDLARSCDDVMQQWPVFSGAAVRRTWTLGDCPDTFPGKDVTDS